MCQTVPLAAERQGVADNARVGRVVGRAAALVAHPAVTFVEPACPTILLEHLEPALREARLARGADGGVVERVSHPRAPAGRYHEEVLERPRPTDDCADDLALGLGDEEPVGAGCELVPLGA